MSKGGYTLSWGEVALTFVASLAFLYALGLVLALFDPSMQ